MSAPRFPAVAAHKGHYESYYLRAADPAGGRSAWIRHTVFKRPGGPATGALWCTLFEAGKEPRAVKQSLPDPRARRLADDRRQRVRPARREAAAPRRSAAARPGTSRFGPASEPLRHLPHPRLYDAPLPRTKTESPLPDTTISGRVEDWELDAWPGVIGHNWGAEHAERWIWLHGVGFEGAPDAWLDVALGRVKVGPLTTPWIANGALHLDGERVRVGGLGRRARVDERADGGTHRGRRRQRSRSAPPRSSRGSTPTPPAASTAARTARWRASSSPSAAARCAPSTAAPGSSARARRRPASRSSPTRTRSYRPRPYRSSTGSVVGPTCSSSQSTTGPAARHTPATCPSAASRDSPPSAGQPARRRSAACAAAARSAGGPADSPAARSSASPPPRRARPSRAPPRAPAPSVGGHRRAVALELVARDPVVARPGVEPARRERRVVAAEHAVGAVLVGPLVGREAQVAVLAEDLDLAVELRASARRTSPPCRRAPRPRRGRGWR